MIGQSVTDKDGKPVSGNGTALSESAYQPPEEVKKLYARVQRDFQVAWGLQHRNFDEFDGMSLLDRAKVDQQTFGAYVGMEFVPQHNRWRFRGRKQTSRNKLIGILAHMLAAMLFPYVKAFNDRNEEDKMTARVMSILVEHHLKKAGYETKFLYLVLSALVNPAVICQVQYVQVMQTIKDQLADGSVDIITAVDELMSGLQLNIVPIDELFLADFYTNNIQAQPYLIRVRRIGYDYAKGIYGDHPDWKHVHAGQTRVLVADGDNSTLYDVEWTEADRGYVQEVTAMYRSEDLQVTWVGGVFMGNSENIYNTNPFEHRRMVFLQNGEWASVPVYNYAMTGFEPIDPTGRFAYYKSGAFKEYWDDKALNVMHKLVLDGTYLDVFKPIFASGIAKMDSTVIAPGAFVGMPMNATVNPYSLGPNLSAAYQAMQAAAMDLGESTQDKIMSGGADPNVTAYATAKAEQNARIILGVFGVMMADLIVKVGELTKDCVVMHGTVQQIDATVPETVKGKFHSYITSSKHEGKNVTNRVIFTDRFMGMPLTKKEKQDMEWDLYEEAGGYDSDQRIYLTNPYAFARTTYSMWVDADQILSKSMGTEMQRNAMALQILTSPAVAPWTDQEAVVEDFAIEPFADGDIERYKRKQDPNQMMGAMMGQAQQGAQLPGIPNSMPTQTTSANVPV